MKGDPSIDNQVEATAMTDRRQVIDLYTRLYNQVDNIWSRVIRLSPTNNGLYGAGVEEWYQNMVIAVNRLEDPRYVSDDLLKAYCNRAIIFAHMVSVTRDVVWEPMEVHAGHVTVMVDKALDTAEKLQHALEEKC
jgi:DNA-directed RNA polymerase subunit N (RpoN/RPB10)